jgi:lambda repressor-like predicted transcriptional regulator
MMNIDNMARKIKALLILKGIPGAGIARKMNVDRTAIYHVIMGRSKSKRIRKAIAEALDMRVEDLWGEDGV